MLKTKQNAAILSTEREEEPKILDSLSNIFGGTHRLHSSPWSSVSTNHRNGPEWISAATYRLAAIGGNTTCFFLCNKIL